MAQLGGFQGISNFHDLSANRLFSSLLLAAEALEAAIELLDLSALANLQSTTSPGRVRFWINVERERIAFGTHGGAGLEGRTVGHHHIDLMVIRVDILFHGTFLAVRWPVYSGQERKAQVPKTPLNHLKSSGILI